MQKRFVIIIILGMVIFNKSEAQIYDSDTLRIEIKHKKKFLAQSFKDLNIEIEYLAKAREKPISTYQRLQSHHSSLGNCFFELYKFDSLFSGYQNITVEVMGNLHPSKYFRNEQEILKYDVKKTPLNFGAKRVLTFNLLNFTPMLLRGEYSLKIYLRVRDTFGHDNNGNLITNSIYYLESSFMNFEVQEDLFTPTKF